MNPRVPLLKGKSAREVLEEQGLWEEYKVKYPYNPMGKFERSAVGKVPMFNNADVGNREQINMITSDFRTFTF